MFVAYARHTFIDWPDDSALYGALILFFNGCDFQCKGCHNSHLKSFKKVHHTPDHVKGIIEHYGAKLPTRKYEYIILSGGDPLASLNYEDTIALVKELRDFKIMVYTGQEIAKVSQMPIKGPIYYKCGKYLEKYQQQPGHRNGAFHLASTNQTLLNFENGIVSENGVYRYR